MVMRKLKYDVFGSLQSKYLAAAVWIPLRILSLQQQGNCQQYNSVTWFYCTDKHVIQN